VPTGRSSPHVVDLDGDDRKDLLMGNTAGQLVFYANVGTDQAPSFSGPVLVTADGVPIDLPSSPRSRPFAGDWTGDGRTDVLLGAGDGLIRLYRGTSEATGTPLRSPAAPTRARLLAAFPNPFRSPTTIPFELGRGAHVHLSVHDLAGRRIARVADDTFGPGAHSMVWTGVDEAGRPVPSGVYFVRMRAGNTAVSRKLVLLR
jgi:hypothetical protein